MNKLTWWQRCPNQNNLFNYHYIATCEADHRPVCFVKNILGGPGPGVTYRVYPGFTFEDANFETHFRTLTTLKSHVEERFQEFMIEETT